MQNFEVAPLINRNTLLKAYTLMQTAKYMSEVYEQNRKICQYVHATSRGHEAIQLAVGMQLRPEDYLSPYYRDDAILLGTGIAPYEMMLQLLAKGDDPFSGGRSYYAHAANRSQQYPNIIHQSSATGMQAIPSVGIAQGIQYQEQQNLTDGKKMPIVVCSLGDSSLAEGEVSEAFHVAAFKQLPILFLVQDNEWGISVKASECRTTNAYEYAGGFKGLDRISIDGSNFSDCYQTMSEVISHIRTHRTPILVHAKVPLLAHHTSGVRKEWYRSKEDLQQTALQDPLLQLARDLQELGVPQEQLDKLAKKAYDKVVNDFQVAVAAPSPSPETITLHEFAPTPITQEKGERTPANGKKVIMVDAALFAMNEILANHPEAIFYGQDVGRRLGGVFREAATLAEKYGDERVFNTAIQEAYIVGSTAGMSAVGLKPIVEIQFADYFWPGFNQLVTEISKSCYLTMGKYPIQTLIRVPVGAYGGGGPYHSASIESTLLTIRGIKIVYPSNAADMKGLLKAAFHDPNPVVLLEHKGLYWSKVKGTAEAKTIEPDEKYVVPLGKGRVVKSATPTQIDNGNSLCIITYGMGVHWSINAAKHFEGRVEIIDLRTLYPLDEALIYQTTKRHGKVLVLTEEPTLNSFAESLAGRISKQCFQYLDAPVEVMGAMNLPAIPLNKDLENIMLPTVEKVKNKIAELLTF